MCHFTHTFVREEILFVYSPPFKLSLYLQTWNHHDSSDDKKLHYLHFYIQQPHFIFQVPCHGGWNTHFPWEAANYSNPDGQITTHLLQQIKNVLCKGRVITTWLLFCVSKPSVSTWWGPSKLQEAECNIINFIDLDSF